MWEIYTRILFFRSLTNFSVIKTNMKFAAAIVSAVAIFAKQSAAVEFSFGNFFDNAASQLTNLTSNQETSKSLQD